MRVFRISVALVLLGFACGGKSVSIGGEPGIDVAGTASGGVGAFTGGSGGTTGGKGGVATSGGTGGDFLGGASGVPVTGGTAFGGTGASSAGGAVTGGNGSGSGTGPLAPPGPVYCGGVLCEAPRACCLRTSTCFDPETESESCPPPAPDPDDTSAQCASNAHCADGEMCSLSLRGDCQGTGHCTSTRDCPGGSNAVCGCDGNDYATSELACRSGSQLGYYGLYPGGHCGQIVDANQGAGVPPHYVTLCGFDAQCSNGERCCPITGICYSLSDPGRCQVPPDGTDVPCTADDQCFPALEFCAGDGCGGPGGCVSLERVAEDCGVRLEPVCGCNGVTYTSQACAWSEGVRVASEGECER